MSNLCNFSSKRLHHWSIYTDHHVLYISSSIRGVSRLTESLTSIANVTVYSKCSSLQLHFLIHCCGTNSPARDDIDIGCKHTYIPVNKRTDWHTSKESLPSELAPEVGEGSSKHTLLHTQQIEESNHRLDSSLWTSMFVYNSSKQGIVRLRTVTSIVLGPLSYESLQQVREVQVIISRNW